MALLERHVLFLIYRLVVTALRRIGSISDTARYAGNDSAIELVPFRVYLLNFAMESFGDNSARGVGAYYPPFLRLRRVLVLFSAT